MISKSQIHISKGSKNPNFKWLLDPQFENCCGRGWTFLLIYGLFIYDCQDVMNTGSLEKIGALVGTRHLHIDLKKMRLISPNLVIF